MEDDDILDRAIVLDVAGDVFTKIHLKCSGCGFELSVVDLEEVAEHGLTLEVGMCHECTQRAHWNGVMEGRDNGMGY